MLANLRVLLGVFVDIILLRRGPEHLPASRALLAVLVVLHIVAYACAYLVFLAALMHLGAAAIWLGNLFSAVLLLLWFRVALQLAGKPERFVQTMIAVFFVSLLGVVLVPMVAALFPYTFAAQPDPAGTPPVALMLFSDVLSLWILAMFTRVVKSAFEWSWLGSIGFVALSLIGVPLLFALLLGGGSGAS